MVSFKSIYRASLTQAVLIGIISFTQPGIWTALSNLGAGGLATVTTAYVCTSISYAFMAVLGPLTSMFMNKFGILITLYIGCIGYVIYSAGLYLNSKTGAQWLMLLGGVTCGISSGPLWGAEAAIAMIYPERTRRGLFIGIWQALNKTGSIIAGIILVILNRDSNKAGKVSLNTYIVLIALQASGILFAMCVSPPEKVIRSDGTKVPTNVTNESFKEMLQRYVKVLKKKEVLILAPLMMTNSWYKTWQSNYMTHNFSVRSRALNVLLAAVVSAAGDLFGSWFLDSKRFSNRTKAKFSWAIVVSFLSAYFIWAFIVEGHIMNNNITNLDWSGSPYFITAFVPFQIFKLPVEFVFNWVWWVAGTYEYETADISYVIGIIRSLESLGPLFAYVIGVVNKDDMVNLGISAAFFWVTVPFGTYIAFTVPNHSRYDNSEESLVSEEEEFVDEKQNGDVKVFSIASHDNI